MANAIFISYRRDDSEGEAGRLFDDLTRAFGSENVFMDVDGIHPGADFRKAIENNVANCGVLLGVIGPNWVGITDASGQRRLDDPNDFVALEIASALKRDVPVIPVLVHEARMPKAEQLPDNLKELPYRNCVEISHSRWNSDVQLLIQALAAYVTPKQASRKSRLPVILACVLVLILVIAAVIYFARAHASNGVAQAPAAVSPARAMASGGPASLVGAWKDPDPRKKKDKDSLASLALSGSGSNLSMHAFGLCQPPPCDWGSQSASFDGVNATATFNAPADPGTTRAATVVVHLTGSNLDVTIDNTFKSAAGSWQNSAHRLFIPGP